MSHIYLCFVWHMHQPFYKDLLSGEYKLPWTRMHALKDYYGMVKVLEEFPEVHQTFNLVPSMMTQIEEYAEGNAADPFFRIALRPAEQLSEQEQLFILQYFFQANVQRMIYRYPRYGELYDAWHKAEKNFIRAQRYFGTQAMRDLQVLSQLAWFDEEWLEKDADLRDLVQKERNYSLEDQSLLGRKQIEVTGRVIPVYKDFSNKGQIEISTTPFYHPILPLLCDSNIAEVAHPYVPLPSRFRYPQDAQHQLARAREYMMRKIGKAPVGLWPSEGSVSDEVLRLAAENGFSWIATDNGILAKTLHQSATAALTYRPYLWKQDGREIKAIFRDHYLSDLIGFVYARMGAVEAANHFLDRIRENCAPILSSGRDAVVPIILDGENAWEYYDRSGRPFLRELYRRITDDKRMTALTVSEALERVETQTIGNIAPGSWINANFDIWIGAEEDNHSWEFLLKARETYDRVMQSPDAARLSEDRKALAFEELLIAEGSDWCWWYGPEHDSANKPEFDQLFRDHVANVYLALNVSPPEDLSRAILKVAIKDFHRRPAGPIRATIDGQVSSYFEWLGAGLYRVDSRTGAMHGQRFFVEELHYGSDGNNLYLRFDFARNSLEEIAGTEIRLNFQAVPEGGPVHSVVLSLSGGDGRAESAFEKICEVKIPLGQHGIAHGQTIRFQISLWHGGLPMDALPPQGWIEFSTAEPMDWLI